MFTHKVYDASVEGYYRTIEGGVGTTLFVGTKTYQVMGDMWEQGSYAVYWNETEGKVRTQDWVLTGVADATPEARAAANDYARNQLFLRLYNEAKDKAHIDQATLSRGNVARIVRGRKFPKGTEGKVVGFSDGQWGRSVGIATSDVTVEVERNGRKFQNHKDVIWVSVGNVERADQPEIDYKRIEAEAAERAAAYQPTWWQN